MKKRYSNAHGNKNILEKDFKYMYAEEKDFKGYISFLKLNKIEQDWYVPREGRDPDCIQAKNYVWLSIYPMDKNYGITAMFDDKEQIVEWYFDVTNSVGIENNVPFIEDLYLDVVITNKGEIIILDEDELEEAYKNNDISKEQYILAINQKDEIVNKYNDKDEIRNLYEFTISCLNIIKNNNVSEERT